MSSFPDSLLRQQQHLDIIYILLTDNVAIAGRELFMSDDTLDDSDVKFLEAGQCVAKYHQQNSSMQRFAHLDVSLVSKQ